MTLLPEALILAHVLAAPAPAASPPAGASPGAPVPSPVAGFEAALDEWDFARSWDVIRELETARPDDPWTAYCRARIAVEQCVDWRTSRTWIEKALAADPARAEFHVVRGDALGVEAMRSGLWKGLRLAPECRRCYERALALDPSCSFALARMIQFCAFAPGIVGGGRDKARALAARLAALDPARGHGALAMIAQREKQWDDAEREYKAAAEADGADARPGARLADFYRRRERWDDAERTARQTIERHRRSLWGYLALAESFRARKRWAEAVSAFRDAEGACGKRPALSDLIVETIVKSGATDGLAEAAAELASAAQEYPDSCWVAAEGYRTLGDAYAKLGRPDEAARSYETCLARNPDDKEAKKSLAALRRRAS